jgi:hypothetical protein
MQSNFVACDLPLRLEAGVEFFFSRSRTVIIARLEHQLPGHLETVQRGSCFSDRAALNVADFIDHSGVAD